MLRRIFNYLLNKIRIFKIYYLFQKIVLSFIIKNQDHLLVKFGKRKTTQIDYKPFQANQIPFYIDYDENERRFAEIRCNSFIKYYRKSVFIDKTIDSLINNLNINNFDTYSLSELSSNYIISCFWRRMEPNQSFLFKILTLIDSKLEYHPFDLTNNHFFNNIRACILISFHLKSKKLNFYIKSLNYFLSKYVSKNGILKFEKSNSYQSLFFTWIYELDFILKSNSYQITNLSNLIAKSNKIISFYRDQLQYGVRVGDTTPDKTSSELIERLSFWIEKYKLKKNSINLFHDDESNFYYAELNELTLLSYYDSEIKYSHSHDDYNSFVVCLNKNVLIGDIGLISYNKKDSWMKNYNYHNNLEIYALDRIVYPKIKSVNVNNYININYEYIDKRIAFECIVSIQKSKNQLDLVYSINCNQKINFCITYCLNKSKKFIYNKELLIMKSSELESSLNYSKTDQSSYKLIKLRNSKQSYKFNFNLKVFR